MNSHAAYAKARALWPWPHYVAFANSVVEGKSYKIGYCIRGSVAPARVYYGTSWEEVFQMAGAQ